MKSVLRKASPRRRTKRKPRSARSVLALGIHDITRKGADEISNGAAKVLAFFHDRLLAGELKPGDRLLGERELAVSLDVSRPVLREALRSLAVLGLLDIQHGRGAFVRRADAAVLGQALTLCLASEPSILDDIMQARIAIECQAIRLACARAGEQDLVGIAASLDTLLASLHDPERSGEADHRFHQGIVRASGSAVLLKIHEALGPLLLRLLVQRMRETYQVPTIRAQVANSHREVFLSLMRREPDDAERRLREHFAIGDELRRNTLISNYEPRSEATN